MKKYILYTILLFILIIAFMGNTSFAADLDEIVNYVVTVDPRMNDGTLDITYEVTWKVLDSTTEGPLTWAKIGTPNAQFDTPTPLSSNIKSIYKYNGTYVRIDFDRAYKAGEQLTFKYKIHQGYMYTLTNQNCEYSFTPAWFTDAKVDSMTILWKADNIESSNSQSKEGDYLIWYKTNLAKGEKMTAEIKYDQSVFKTLDTNKQAKNASKASSNAAGVIGMVFLIFFLVTFKLIFPVVIFGGYYRHRGFYGGHGYRRNYRSHSSCVHSSCACVSSCACACACAGSGRAGCSKKDFYGTKLNKEKIKRIINN